MILKIDTTNNKKSKVQVSKTKIVKSYTDPRGQDILKLVEETLKKAKLKKEDLTEIKVNPGPGAFTSTRVGVAVANALGYSLSISVNGREPGDFVKPVYDKPPSITSPKK